jgi:hypothetical protein
MFAALLRLFALRPLLAGMLFGIPVMTLILLGLATAFVLKALLYVGLPLLGVWLLVRWLRREPVTTS